MAGFKYCYLLEIGCRARPARARTAPWGMGRLRNLKHLRNPLHLPVMEEHQSTAPSKMKIFNISFLLLLLTLISCESARKEAEVVIGTSAPNFEALLSDGRSFELEELEGKYILLDFWGSWCGPCRKEHPELVALYRDFSKQAFEDADGFEIVSVAMELDSAAWQKAIEKDQLPWSYQIMEQTRDLKKVSVPIARSYKIEKVPARFIINPEGEIVGINPSPEAVRTYLNTK
jgi:thiol-disulfide isomerase/thioredoxin